MNEVLQNIINRRSIRKYNDEVIPEQSLNDIIEAGRWAPTGGDSQSVHFTVVMNKSILDTLREKVQQAFSQMELSDDQYISIQHSISASKNGKYVFDYNAPVLIIVSNVKGYPNALADSACALQNMMLAATSLGIGSCWINQLHWLDEDSMIRDSLKSIGIGEEETICGALALGCYDVNVSQKSRKGMQVDFVR